MCDRSFGVLLWEVMSLGYMPYPGRGNQEVMQLVTSGGRLEAPPGCPGPAYRIMVHCSHTNPEERPSFVTVLERIGYCIQDPDVLAMPIPVFQRPLSTEREITTVSIVFATFIFNPPLVLIVPCALSNPYLTSPLNQQFKM